MDFRKRTTPLGAAPGVIPSAQIHSAFGFTELDLVALAFPEVDFTELEKLPVGSRGIVDCGFFTGVFTGFFTGFFTEFFTGDFDCASDCESLHAAPIQPKHRTKTNLIFELLTTAFPSL